MNLIETPGHADVNRTLRTMLLSLYCLIFSVNINGQLLTLRAPELIGTAPAYIVRSGDRLYGLIYAPGAVFAYQGTASAKDISCGLTQIAGEPIQQAEAPVPCYAMLRDGRWIGWIDFRGHERAFCAAPAGERLPRVCKLRKGGE